MLSSCDRDAPPEKLQETGACTTSHGSVQLQICTLAEQQIGYVALFENQNKQSSAACALCAEHLHLRIAETREFEEGLLAQSCTNGFERMSALLRGWTGDADSAAADQVRPAKAVLHSNSEGADTSESECDSDENDSGGWSDEDDGSWREECVVNAAEEEFALMQIIEKESKQTKTELEAARGIAPGSCVAATALLIATGGMRELMGVQRVICATAGNQTKVLLVQPGVGYGLLCEESVMTTGLGMSGQPSLHEAEFKTNEPALAVIVSEEVWKKLSLVDIAEFIVSQYHSSTPEQMAKSLLNQCALPPDIPAGVVVVSLSKAPRGDKRLQVDKQAQPDAAADLLGSVFKTTMETLFDELVQAGTEEKCAHIRGALVQLIDEMKVGRRQSVKGILGAIGTLDKHVALAGPLLHHLYDTNIVTEDEILHWHKGMQECNQVAASDFMMKFVQWLQTADSESSDESEEDE